MVLMASLAMMVGLGFYRLKLPGSAENAPDISVSALMRESCLSITIFLVLGSMIIGLITGSAGMEQVSPFIVYLFHQGLVSLSPRHGDCRFHWTHADPGCQR